VRPRKDEGESSISGTAALKGVGSLGAEFKNGGGERMQRIERMLEPREAHTAEPMHGPARPERINPPFSMPV